MPSTDYARVSFADSNTREDEMHRTIESWVSELSDLVDEAAASEDFREWLDVQSRFHDYSHRNTLLIKLQRPDATRIAGYRTWQREFDRQVRKGEKAIWIWAPIITKRCPECGRSPSYHRDGDCEFEETPPEEWSKGLVGFKPTSVFDVSQTEGEPLPELETEANGDAGRLVSCLLDAADELDIEARIVPMADWDHGAAKGVCIDRNATALGPLIEVQEQRNRADVAVTLVHELAHAQMHFDGDDREERSKREVEAEAVAYIVGRFFGLDTSGSAFYLAAWDGDAPDSIYGRLTRISATSDNLIAVVMIVSRTLANVSPPAPKETVFLGENDQNRK